MVDHQAAQIILLASWHDKVSGVLDHFVGQKIATFEIPSCQQALVHYDLLVSPVAIASPLHNPYWLHLFFHPLSQMFHFGIKCCLKFQKKLSSNKLIATPLNLAGSKIADVNLMGGVQGYVANKLPLQNGT